MLSEQAIQEFIALYKKQFAVDLDITEAREKATALLNFYKTLTEK